MMHANTVHDGVVVATVWRCDKVPEQESMKQSICEKERGYNE